MTGDRSQLVNFVQKFQDTVKFENDHVAKIIGYGNYKIGNVTISRVYSVEGLGHNLFFMGQFCDSDLETISVLHLQWAKLRRNHTILNLKTLIKEKLYLLHMDLCGPMRVESVNGKKYILIIVDDNSRFTWVKCLRSKDEAPDFIIKFLKMIQVRLKVPVRSIRTDNGTEFVNQTLREYYEQVSISHETSVSRSPQQNSVVERHNRTLIEATRTMALCYPKNDREDIGKLGAKGDIGFFIGYSADSCAYRVYNRRRKKIMETINVSFDELSAMAFEQCSSKPGLQSMTSGQISSGLDLTYSS
nr:hypothetical protein [Tanacetum cinerariifolium]